MRTYLERGYIPHICEQTELNLDDNIAYTFLIHGQVRPHSKPDLEFVGPSFIPDSIRVLHFNVSFMVFTLYYDQNMWQQWDSNPRPFGLVPKTSALDRSAMLPWKHKSEYTIFI